MTTITLDLYEPRDYQLPLLNALERDGYRRLLAIFPRRAGKDITCFNIMIRQMLMRPAVYYYIFPTYAQAKKAIWDTITNDGMRVLDYIPQEIIESSNSQELKIRLKNGSLFQLIGSENYNLLMGTNPYGVVFSEYALQNPKTRDYIEPILAANGGWQIIQSTPRAKNHFWHLYQYALKSDKWFVQKLTLDDTKHISQEELDQMRDEGKSEDFIQQEFYCSFDMGVEGAYYTRYVENMRKDGRIGVFPHNPSYKVHTAWDIGVSDSTAIIFFQVIEGRLYIIDTIEKQKEGLEYYATSVNRKPYNYGTHIAPHDIAVKEWGGGLTRFQKAKNLGINFQVAPNIPIMDGIEAVRGTLSICSVDERKAQPLLHALESYREEWDEKNQISRGRPKHDRFSHMADAIRYLAVSVHLVGEGDVLTPDRLRELRQQASGYQGNTIENFFSQHHMR